MFSKIYANYYAINKYISKQWEEYWTAKKYICPIGQWIREHFLKDEKEI